MSKNKTEVFKRLLTVAELELLVVCDFLRPFKEFLSVFKMVSTRLNMNEHECLHVQLGHFITQNLAHLSSINFLSWFETSL